jgi:hypothetical protein
MIMQFKIVFSITYDKQKVKIKLIFKPKYLFSTIFILFWYKNGINHPLNLSLPRKLDNYSFCPPCVLGGPSSCRIDSEAS